MVFKTVSVAAAFLSVLFLFRPLLSSYYGSKTPPTEDSLKRASRITSEDAWRHYVLGLFYQQGHDRSGLDKAVKSYLSSLRRNPVESRTWLGLAQACRELGDRGLAALALKRAVALDGNNPALLWEAGVFSLGGGEVSYALQQFRKYLTLVPEEQEQVYSLFHSMKIDNGRMLEALLPPDRSFYKRYLKFVMARKLLDESAETWVSLKPLGPGREDYIGYCNFLIESGELDRAEGLWSEFLKAFADGKGEKGPASLVRNGDFEAPLENWGFDWRIGRADGVRIFRDRDISKTGNASLSARFDGKHNPGLAIISQIVPVEPRKRYRFSGSLKTEKITTTNGIFFEVAGHKCESLVKRSEPLTGTNLWTRVELDFVAPGACKAVVVRAKRERSQKFDNKISGDAWLDSLSVDQAK